MNMKKVVYVDNNATTRVDPDVLEEMKPYFCDIYGNPSSMHSFGGQVAGKLLEARERVAAFINVSPEEIIFTGCGTESNNTAIRGVLEAFPEKHHIVTSSVEHPAVLNVCREMAKHGYSLTEVPVFQDGLLDLDMLAESLSNDTALVSIMYANNETGVISQIEEIEQIVKEKGIIFHSDAVQAAGKIPLDLRQRNIDLLSISGHKLHAPKGVGLLYIRKGTRCKPFMLGGHQEYNRRAGTENVASIIGLGKACELAVRHMEYENTKVKHLRDKLEKKILEKINKAVVNGNKKRRLPNTTNIGFEFIEGEAILLMMDQYLIAASSGSACTSGSLEPSHVLRAMKVPQTSIQGSIRFSLSRYNTEEEVEYIIEKLPPIIDRLREISPFWK